MKLGLLGCWVAGLLILASCTPAVTPPPAVTPQGEDRFLIDPRTGSPTADAQTERKLEAAWRFALSGNETEARRLLDEIRKKNPNYAPAWLTEAAIDIRARHFDAARAILKKFDTLAARVYAAEIEARDTFRIYGTPPPYTEGHAAYVLYRDLAREPNAPPVVAERLAQLEENLFNEYFKAAQSTPDPAVAVTWLREALAFRPAAVEPRILLARKLVLQRSFDEARRELDPLLNSGEVDRAEVQELLAEIDVGRGRYQEAIVRYDRLARRTREPRYQQRLDQIKEEWSMANMPSHYRAALESPAITRADLAVLLYWTVPSIRFARNLGSPTIAVDLEDVAGREEMIRAIAIGLYDVDPVTRRVGPLRTVTADRLSRNLVRVLQLRGAACARGVAAEKVLATCGVTDPLATFAPDATVTGRDAEKMLQQVAKALH